MLARARLVLAVALLVGVALPSVAQDASPAQALLARSVDHHDPDGRWWSHVRTLTLEQARPDGPTSRVTVTLFPDTSQFRMRMEQDDAFVAVMRSNGECTFSSSAPENRVPDAFGDLTCEDVQWRQAYYGFLLSLPMNLRDSRATIEPEVRTMEWEGRTVQTVRARYPGDEPVWDFYVDPETAALVGCAFSSAGTLADGETIVFEGTVEAEGIRLPKTRRWVTNADDRLLGTDTIVSIETAAP